MSTEAKKPESVRIMSVVIGLWRQGNEDWLIAAVMQLDRKQVSSIIKTYENSL